MITGHTGFKGSWLALWLHELGANVSGYALDPPTTPSNFVASRVADALAADHRADIRDRSRLERAIRDSQPEVVLHLAAQSVVLAGYEDPTETFSVNILGTVGPPRRDQGSRPAVCRPRRHERQVLCERRVRASVRRGRPARWGRSLQCQQGRNRTRRRGVSRFVLPDRARSIDTESRSPRRGQETSSAAAIGPRMVSSQTSCERSRRASRCGFGARMRSGHGSTCSSRWAATSRWQGGSQARIGRHSRAPGTWGPNRPTRPAFRS